MQTTNNDSNQGEAPRATSVARRSEADLRNEHLEKGALLLRFHLDKPDTNPDVVIWRGIEKKGFLVTTAGCLIPHSVHWFRSRARHEGARIFLKVANSAAQSTPASSNDSSAAATLGWPTGTELSHLCHDSNCCNPQHVVIEAKWINSKRNYCGSSGVCDCGMKPACVATYQKEHDYKQEALLSYSTHRLSNRLSEMFAANCNKVEVLNRNSYLVEDRKRENRLARRRRAKRHERQAKDNAARKSRRDANNRRYFDDAPQ